MSDNKLYVGNTPLHNNERDVEGAYTTIDGEAFYRISDYDRLRPFFISLVSHSDHWLFLSSTGGLTAGRKNENSALFPYTTDDKLADASETTGSKSVFRVRLKNKTYLWEPFSVRYQGLYAIRRNLYKNRTGNRIVFEEENPELQLIFRYSWQFSEEFGFVKASSVLNLGKESVSVVILDGIQNIVPYGVRACLKNP